MAQRLTPEEKLAIAVIRSWIEDYKRWIKSCIRFAAVMGREPPRIYDLYYWPETEIAHFWIDACGGSLAQLKRYRDELWQQVLREARRQKGSKRTQRASKDKTSNVQATRKKTTRRNKRAKLNESPMTRERVIKDQVSTCATTKEKTGWGKRLDPALVEVARALGLEHKLLKGEFNA